MVGKLGKLTEHGGVCTCGGNAEKEQYNMIYVPKTEAAVSKLITMASNSRINHE